jgi:hypothetical protein
VDVDVDVQDLQAPQRKEGETILRLWRRREWE